MFWFFKPKPLNLHFFTTREVVFNHARPKKAAAFAPEWFKRLPPPSFSDHPDAPLTTQKTLRTCAGFTSLYSSGFILPMWCDLHIEVRPDGYRYQFADGVSKIMSHSQNQIAGSPFPNTHFHLKVENPWFVTADKKANLVFTAPVWNNFGYDDIVVIPGACSVHSITIDANINLFVKRKETKTVHTILFGQPLAHVIPMTERPLKLHYELVTEQELNRVLHRSPIYMMDANRYRRAEKMCPHAK
jgi:hypothetical protein